MRSKIKIYQSAIEKIKWASPLLARITVGIVFSQSGWGKLQNLDQVAQYFTSLGIPYAAVQAPLVAGLEFVGGIFLLLGLLTRIISWPLIAIMFVAILTAKFEEVVTVADVFGFSEFSYIVLLLWLVTAGPGLLSFDYFIFKKKGINL